MSVADELNGRLRWDEGVSVAEALRAELVRANRDDDVPALNSARLLQLAAGTTDLPKPTREAVAAVLRDYWTCKEQQR